MTKNVNKEPLYMFVYALGSEVTHASNYGHHLRFQSERKVTFYSIRHSKGFSTTVRLTAFGIFMKILHEYREGESARFSQKYVEKWQQASKSIPELKINERDLGV